MALHTLRLRRFRGVASAEVNFERTTLLIGENDCGMSSVIEALVIALSPAAGERPKLETRHFHLAAQSDSATGLGAIEIELTIVESKADSWDRADLSALAPVAGPATQKVRKLLLQICAEPPDNTLEVETRWTIRGPGGVSRDDVNVLHALRQINPLVWLHRQSVAAAPVSAHPEAGRLLLGYDFLERGAVDASGTFETGYTATRRVLADLAPSVEPRGPAMRAVVAEILAQGRQPVASTQQANLSKRTGSAAQELEVFLVAAQIVHELRLVSRTGIRPLLLVEEPEAHLHPMTLASVWGLLELFTVQKIVTTHSGALLSAAPLRSIRRLVRDGSGVVHERRVAPAAMRADELRKVGYHLRARRQMACFARTWLLIEGETEFWILPELARLCGYDFAQEGIVSVEFAQCGLAPLLKLANGLGISWHVLTDGDRAGDTYAAAARQFLRQGEAVSRLTRLRAPDIEHCFWDHGYSHVFEQLAGVRAGNGVGPTRVIRKALDHHSKPGVAFELLAAVAAPGSPGPPPPLRQTIEACIRLARGEVPTRSRRVTPRGPLQPRAESATNTVSPRVPGRAPAAQQRQPSRRTRP